MLDFSYNATRNHHNTCLKILPILHGRKEKNPQTKTKQQTVSQFGKECVKVCVHVFIYMWACMCVGKVSEI